MPAELQAIWRFECTFKDCKMSFDTKEHMINHKKYSDEHEFCKRCDEDFDTHEDYVMHKITRPDQHNKACRVCGDEFKSESGLKRHIELNHKIDQKLSCIGCDQSFYRACLFIEHLEFGHCNVIPATQFQGHIVHKHLITELLKAGPALERFNQKRSKYEAALDYDEEGGIGLDDPLGEDEDIEGVKFEAMKPDTLPDTPLSSVFDGPYPPLPSQAQFKFSSDKFSEVASTLAAMSMDGESDTSTAVGSMVSASFSPLSANVSVHRESSVHEPSAHSSSTRSSSPQLKVWGSRNGKSSSSTLFPNAKPTPAPSEFSIAAHDEAMNNKHGINIMRTRFWDPMSSDWNPEQFYDAIISKYYCPFICEQTFLSSGDLNKHILGDHRITRMKCPMCLKYFKSATALVAHCESRGAKCQLNKANNYGLFLDRISGGFLGVKEKIRPDHLHNPPVLLSNAETGRPEVYRPPVASYLQYMVTTPPDWKDPAKAGMQIGGMPRREHW